MSTLLVKAFSLCTDAWLFITYEAVAGTVLLVVEIVYNITPTPGFAARFWVHAMSMVALFGSTEWDTKTKADELNFVKLLCCPVAVKAQDGLLMLPVLKMELVAFTKTFPSFCKPYSAWN